MTECRKYVVLPAEYLTYFSMDIFMGYSRISMIFFFANRLTVMSKYAGVLDMNNCLIALFLLWQRSHSYKSASSAVNCYCTFDAEEFGEACFESITLDIDGQLQERIMSIRDVLTSTAFRQVCELPCKQQIHDGRMYAHVVVERFLTILECRNLLVANRRVQFILKCLQVEADELVTILLLVFAKPALEKFCKLLQRPISDISVGEHPDCPGGASTV